MNDGFPRPHDSHDLASRSPEFAIPRSPEFPNSGVVSIGICNAGKRLAQSEESHYFAAETIFQRNGASQDKCPTWEVKNVVVE